MKIRAKFMGLTIIFIVAWIGLMMYFMETKVMSGYYSLEEAYFESEYQRLQRGIDGLVARMEPILLDWAKWDDTYNYLDDLEPKFIKSNMTNILFEDLKMNYVMIFGDGDQLLYSAGYDLEKSQFVFVPDELKEDVSQYKDQNGILYIDDRPLIVSTSQITDSDGKAYPRGLLVFGYYLDDEHMKILSESYELNARLVSRFEEVVEIETAKDIRKSEEFSARDYYVSYLNRLGYLKFEVVLANSVSQLGQETTKDALWLFIISFILLGSIVYTAFNSIVKRVLKLSHDVARITHKNEMNHRLHIRGKDELGDLKDDINLMLDKIEEMNEQLTEYATLDMMTGVVNRRIGFERLEKLMDLFKPNHRKLTICFIDINDLKVVNDKLGHNMGDQLIIDVTDIVKANIRKSDVLCRLGGDEFLVIFPDAGEEEAAYTMDRIAKQMNVENVKGERPYRLSISKGIEEYDGEADVDLFVERADKKMYVDKQLTKNMVKKN